MDCKRCRIEIEEAGLGAPLGGAAESHLADCAGCRGFHAGRASLRGLVAGLARVDAPNDFEFHLRARLAAEGSGRARAGWQSYLPRAAWVAMAGCLLLAVGVSLRPRQTATPGVAGNDPQASSALEVNVAGNGSNENRQLLTDSPEPASSGESVKVAKAGDEAGKKSKTNTRPIDRRLRRQAIVPGSVLGEIAEGVGRAEMVEEHSRSVIGGTVIPLPVSADERPLQVTFQDMQGVSRVVKVEPVAFGSREPAAGGPRVVKATHKQGVW